jgi:hypothetical protein
VTITVACGDPSNPEVQTTPLAGVYVTGVYVKNATTIEDLNVSVSSDGTGAYQLVPPSSCPTTDPTCTIAPPLGVLFMTPNVVSDANGNATFTMMAKSVSTPFLGGPNDSPQFIGMQLDFSLGTTSGSAFVGYDEGNIFAATPELDSIALFASGAAGLAGYAMLRMRARRRA